MNERIRKLRKTLDLTQAVFAERIGMKQNSIALVESGKRNISDYALRVICREFNVNENWLQNGDGDMFNPDPASELDALAERYHLTDAARILIENFISLKPEQQDAVADFIQKVAADLDRNSIHALSANTTQNAHDSLEPQTATKEEKMAAYQEYLDEKEKKRREAN